MAKKKQTQPTKRAIKKKTAVPEVDLPEDKEGRARVLYRLYSQEVEGESHTERLKSLMELTGLGKTTVYRQCLGRLTLWMCQSMFLSRR